MSSDQNSTQTNPHRSKAQKEPKSQGRQSPVNQPPASSKKRTASKALQKSIEGQDSKSKSKTTSKRKKLGYNNSSPEVEAGSDMEMDSEPQGLNPLQGFQHREESSLAQLSTSTTQ